MRITLSPQRSDEALAVVVSGDTVTINKKSFDFSVIPDGATLPAEAVDSPFVTGEITREGGELHVTLILPHGAEPPASVAFPADIVNPPDGRLALPTMEDDNGET